jgi:hypothetical protein
MSEPHDVVKLLLARMESHPEEFKVATGPERWGAPLDMIQDYGSEADKAALNAKLRDIVMGEAHEDVMDELLNGPERRRKEEEEREYERNLIMQKARNTSMTQQYGGASLPVSTSPYQNATAQGIVGKSLRQTWLDEYVNTGSITAAQPEPTLSTSAIDQIKKSVRS